MSEPGQLIRNYRQAQKPPVTLEDLAERIGTSKANLSRIESGKQPISDDLLPKLAIETSIPKRLLRPDLAALMEEGAQ